MTQPLDVLKTRQMNAKPGEFRVCIFFIVLKIFRWDVFFLMILMFFITFNVLEYVASNNIHC